MSISFLLGSVLSTVRSFSCFAAIVSACRTGGTFSSSVGFFGQILHPPSAPAPYHYIRQPCIFLFCFAVGNCAVCVPRHPSRAKPGCFCRGLTGLGQVTLHHCRLPGMICQPGGGGIGRPNLVPAPRVAAHPAEWARDAGGRPSKRRR